ncbi:MAG: PilZ domain-containing protein [Hyphomicrobiaceae bacterium]|nr:PilZ domain-containing protein [Hyphomicrobiaceae bacterium]
MSTSRRERRQFSRKVTCLHASIRVPGRPPLVCLVRDLSVQGAYLELPVPNWLPETFQLRIDVARFAADCELRHARANGCGVLFADELPLFDARLDAHQTGAEAWSDHPAPSLRRDRH